MEGVTVTTARRTAQLFHKMVDRQRGWTALRCPEVSLSLPCQFTTEILKVLTF